MTRCPAGSTLTQLGEGFTGGTSYGVGVGYQLNSWFRADITGEYRSRVSFSGTDVATFTGGSTLSDVYQGGYSSWVGLVNAYADLGTWYCLTPFVGFGVGAAHIQTSGLQDSGLSFAPGVGYFRRLFLFRQRRFDDQLRMGRTCRCCLQGQQQLLG